MPALDLLRRNAKALAPDAAKEAGGEQAIVATGDDPCRDVRPRLER
jgi:hypothetical protein